MQKEKEIQETNLLQKKEKRSRKKIKWNIKTAKSFSKQNNITSEDGQFYYVRFLYYLFRDYSMTLGLNYGFQVRLRHKLGNKLTRNVCIILEALAKAI